jgi:hypothetical protein
MRRREFIALLGGATAWPLAARAQPAAGTLRVGAVSFTPRSEPIWVAFEQRLAELGYKRAGTLFSSSSKSRASRGTRRASGSSLRAKLTLLFTGGGDWTELGA